MEYTIEYAGLETSSAKQLIDAIKGLTTPKQRTTTIVRNSSGDEIRSIALEEEILSDGSTVLYITVCTTEAP